MFHTCHWFLLSRAWTLAKAKWPHIQLKSVLYVFPALWYQIKTDMKNTGSSSLSSHKTAFHYPTVANRKNTGSLSCLLVLSLSCPIISFPLWFIPQLSAKYGQIRSRIIPCVEKLAIKCVIYLPQEECVSDGGKESVRACVMCAAWLQAEIPLPSGALLSFVGLQGVEQRETEIESPVTKTSPTQPLSSLISGPRRVCRDVCVEEICLGWPTVHHTH